MKLNVSQSVCVVIDTAPERARIDAEFKKGSTRHRKLHQLMDLIEAGNMQAASKQLTGRWWCGTDRDAECCRREFVGTVTFADGQESWPFESDLSYEDLVEMCVRRPRNIQVDFETGFQKQL